MGIGPIVGLAIAVKEKNYDTDELTLTSPDGSVTLEYDSGTITVTAAG